MDDVIKLVAKEYVKNSYGVPIESRTYREVYCQIHSITRLEFFDAGRNGLNPAFMFTTASVNYNGESLLEYQGKTYSIYRTYQVPGTDYIELYVERKGGSNGKEDNSGQSTNGNQQDP